MSIATARQEHGNGDEGTGKADKATEVRGDHVKAVQLEKMRLVGVGRCTGHF